MEPIQLKIQIQEATDKMLNSDTNSVYNVAEMSSWLKTNAIYYSDKLQELVGDDHDSSLIVGVQATLTTLELAMFFAYRVGYVHATLSLQDSQ